MRDVFATEMHWEVRDDVAQTRIRDAITLSGGAGSAVYMPPPGQFWVIDRVTAQVDTGATAVLTLYDGSLNAYNIVSGGVAQAGLGSITGAFNPPIEIGQEGLRVALSGVGGAFANAQVSIGIWYRRRFRVLCTPKPDAFFPVVPSDVVADTADDIASEAPERATIPVPALVQPWDDERIDEENPGPLVADSGENDVTYR